MIKLIKPTNKYKKALLKHLMNLKKKEIIQVFLMKNSRGKTSRSILSAYATMKKI